MLHRLAIGLLLFALIGLPLLQPFSRLLLTPQAWQAWTESDRLLILLRNTSLLLSGTLSIALPLGIGAAILLYRCNLPWRRTLGALILLTLFIPLPLFTSAWQAILGSGGLWPTALWNPVRDSTVGGGGMVWSPWGQGLVSAIWIHALTGLPWVILLVGQGLLAVEPALEEDAVTAAGPWRACCCAFPCLCACGGGGGGSVGRAANQHGNHRDRPDAGADLRRGGLYANQRAGPVGQRRRWRNAGPGGRVARGGTGGGAGALLTLRWDRGLPAGTSSARHT